MTVKKYIDFLDLKDDEQLSSGKLLNKMDGNISFNNVSYSYSDEKDLIKNLSLKIKKNSSVAFVGESGSGKSTIIKLIIGLIKI